MVAFGEWLNNELRERQMTAADLTRRAGISAGTVSRWLSGTRIPDTPSCERVATTLGVEVDAVLVAAGHLKVGERRIDQLERELAALRSEDARIHDAYSRLDLRSRLVEEQIQTKERELLRLQSRGTDDLPDLTRQVVEVLDEYPMPDAPFREIRQRVIDIMEALSRNEPNKHS